MRMLGRSGSDRLFNCTRIYLYAHAIYPQRLHLALHVSIKPLRDDARVDSIGHRKFKFCRWWIPGSGTHVSPECEERDSIAQRLPIARPERLGILKESELNRGRSAGQMEVVFSGAHGPGAA